VTIPSDVKITSMCEWCFNKGTARSEVTQLICAAASHFLRIPCKRYELLTTSPNAPSFIRSIFMNRSSERTMMGAYSLVRNSGATVKS